MIVSLTIPGVVGLSTPPNGRTSFVAEPSHPGAHDPSAKGVESTGRYSDVEEAVLLLEELLEVVEVCAAEWFFAGIGPNE